MELGQAPAYSYWVARGGDPASRFLRLTGALVRAPLVAAGALAGEDLDDHLDAYDDPSFRFVVMTLFGAWGRR